MRYQAKSSAIPSILLKIAKGAKGAKIGQKTVYRPHCWPNFRFFRKIRRIRQSDRRPDVHAKFQPNPTLFVENVFFGQEN